MPKSDITTIGEAYQKMCGEAISLFEKQQKRIAELEKENNKLRDEVEQLRYKLKDEVGGWSPTSSPEPKMNN